MHLKPYYCHTDDTNLSYSKITNNLAVNSSNKFAKEEISRLFDYLEPKNFR